MSGSEVNREKLSTFFEAHDEVQEAYLFGSCAVGLNTNLSDVDLAVSVIPEVLTDTRYRYGYKAELLSELIGYLGRNDVDLVILNQAPPLLYHRVLCAECRLFTRDLLATQEREVRALHLYLDFKPMLQKMQETWFAG